MTAPNYIGYQGSVYPSGQVGAVHGRSFSMYAASDVMQGAVVRLASVGDWTLQMVASSNEKPFGIARDNAAAGKPVDVFYDGITRTFPGAGGSFPRQAWLGVVGTSSAVHPISGVTVTYPVIGQVTGTPSVYVGASAPSIWAVGQAVESAALGDIAGFVIDPTLLSGLVNP